MQVSLLHVNVFLTQWKSKQEDIPLKPEIALLFWPVKKKKALNM